VRVTDDVTEEGVAEEEEPELWVQAEGLRGVVLNRG